MFNNLDRKQIEAHGLSLIQIENQIANFKKGFDYLPIDRAAVVGDGINVLSEDDIDIFTALYDKDSCHTKVVKFVPASGAATRMFKDLFEFVNEDKMSESIEVLLANIDKFAFYDALKSKVGDDSDPKKIVSAIIKDGLNYGSLPKGLILFHKYHDGNRTAAEEHLTEGALYGATNSVSHIHFTVSPEHQAGFEHLMKDVVGKYEKNYTIKYNISYSCQKGSTDTIAVTPDNEPFRNDDGTLLFRPAGHGALIENLNEIDANLIYIKTVDNVAPDRLKGDTIKYKKALGGMLLELQKEIAQALLTLDFESPNEVIMSLIINLVRHKLSIKLPDGFKAKTLDEQAEILRAILNRPIRICGMVRNEGEPGGGPFWVKSADGSQSLQIAESSQIAPEQMALMKDATHFNPVDLVCAVKDYKGNKFDLNDFVDPSTGFISNKSKDGRELRAQELPGLWNGAMANWNTVFVEVPISTFCPVKVVNDLLRDQHQ